MAAWEVLDQEQTALQRLDVALRRRRAVVLLPWTHPRVLPGFSPPFDWNRQPRSSAPLSKRLLFELLRRPPRFPPEEPIPGEALRRVLVFRYDAVGDYIVTTPLLQWLRQALPHVRVDVVASYRNAVLAAHDPTVEYSVAIHPTHGIHPSWVLAAWKLRRHHYDAVFALVFTRMSKAAVLVHLFAPQAEAIVVRHWERSWLYGRVFARQPEHRPWQRHWAESLLAMGVECVRPSVPVEQFPHYFVPIVPSAWERVAQFVSARGLQWQPPERVSPWQRCCWSAIEGQPYAVVNLSAYTRNRAWGPHHALLACRELLNMLPELHLVFTASAPQQRIAQQVAEALGVRAHVFSGGLLELIALIAGAAWVLTPDTAVVHIASAVGKPVVGLYGELIKVAEWFPLDTPFALVLSPAMESITFAPPGAVVEAAEWLLSEVVPRGARIPPVLPTTEAVGAGASEVR